MPNTQINKTRQKIKKKIKKDRQKIKKKIKKDIDNIISGYKVIWEEADGCDEYGIKYWVECKNGFGGRSWDVDPELRKQKKKYIVNIIENGVVYNGMTYYIHPLNYSTLKGRIKFITKNQYKKMSSQMLKIKSVIQKYIDHAADVVPDEYHKLYSKLNPDDLRNYKSLVDNSHILKYKVYSKYNIKLFYLTMRDNFYSDHKYDIMIDKFKKKLTDLNLTPDELELFN